MTIFNVGSINIDHFYQVAEFASAGETISSRSYEQSLGGKGANQSVAISRAGGNVTHIGSINLNDIWIINTLQQYGVSTSGITLSDKPSGHAIVQINQHSENCIVLFDGANHDIRRNAVKRMLSAAGAGDWLLLQNETNLQAETAEYAKKNGLRVAYNPAPMDVALTRSVLPHTDLLIVNEPELRLLSGQADTAQALQAIRQQVQDCEIIVTLGVEGAWHYRGEQAVHVPTYPVDAIDTTAAGDTFIGFLLAGLDQGMSMTDAMRRGCAAAAISVTRRGTSASVPTAQEVNQFLQV